jgi:hypothetical protein
MKFYTVFEKNKIVYLQIAIQDHKRGRDLWERSQNMHQHQDQPVNS